MMLNLNSRNFIFVLALPVFIVACSDNGQTQTSANTESKIVEQVQEIVDIQQTNVDDLINTEDDVHLQDLMHQAAQASRHAQAYNFVWSTTESLIEKGYASAKEGKETEAKYFFQEAKMQFKLSIKQAIYAKQHWALLVPEND